MPAPARVGVRINIVRDYTISMLKHIVSHCSLDCELLPALLRGGEVPQLLRQLAQSHDHHARGVAARTAGLAAHALAAVPDSLALQQLPDNFIVPGLNQVYNPPRIIAVIFGSRTDSSAYTAVHACLQSLLKTDILQKP